MYRLATLVLVAAAATSAGAAALGDDLRLLDSDAEERSFQGGLLRQKKLKWWQTGIIYQIYPSSFKDSNGDGIGDLNGITSKLNYLKDLGVAALWLSPIYKSPNKDMGYDISDYKDIHPNYGTLNDFDTMVEKAHSLGLKVVLDFVPNHSSDEHHWFQEALKGADNPYHNYYVWNEGKSDENGKIVPPTNWGSEFEDHAEGSAWKWVPSLNKYYYRTFHEGQPDLNYRNPTVVAEMKDVFRFWIQRGVDGFRIDAIPYLFEDRLLRDNANGGSERTQNLAETYDMVRQWRSVFDEEGERIGKELVMMLEAYASDIQTMKYFGTKDFPAGHFPFNFKFIQNIGSTSSAADYETQINLWEEERPAFGWSNWVVGNHDNHRVGTRLGEGLVDAINALVLLLPGTAITYYGEELGMLDNTALSLKDCKDPQACPDGADEAYYQEHSRDYERTPFHWDASPHAGFTTGTPWLPVPDDYKQLNVEEETTVETSHLNFYKKVAALRNEPVVQTGKLKVHSQDNILTFLRQTDTSSLLVLLNLGDETKEINVNDIYGFIGDLQVLASSNFQVEAVNLQKVSLQKNAAVVLGGNRFKWWQTGIVYQIYPRSFKDSDDDGIGDLKGITSKLEYLKNLGVTALWLSPIYPSPDVDLGYDITDFKEIDEKYGKMTDFEEMVDKAHKLGLKVVLDFVPNHSSDQHKWFQSALNENDDDHNKYLDYYVWKEPKDKENPQPPNNWKSVFDGSKDGTAWTYVEKLKMYYLHQFHEKQPDLNYNNPDVVQEMKDVLEFWIEKGVDGFRVDAVNHLFEDSEWKDNPENSNEYMVNQPGAYDMVKQWRKLLDEQGKSNKKDLVLMLEAWTEGEYLKNYFGTAEEPGGHFPFNFVFISDLPDKESGDGKSLTANLVKDSIEKWLQVVPDNGWSNWVLGNHDKHRIGSRVGGDLIDAFNMLATLLPGTAITYYGEEIGMLDNTDISVTQCQDKQACPQDDQTPQEDYAKNTRDFERTPMQWTADENTAGFCKSCTPWLPVGEHNEVNVDYEINRRKTHTFIYKKLANLRKEPAIQSGELGYLVENENVLCISRKNDSYAYLLLINFGDEDEIVNIAQHHETVGVVTEHVSSGFKSGQVDLSAVKLPSHSSVVLEGALRQESTEPQELEWWKTGIVYQIYPRSFQDTDGDGVGDLKGITSRLEYLRDLGVAAIWLSPIYSSPDADMGYDISDFKNIDEKFGTLDDFDELVLEAHRLGLKVILDFVPNHSSDEHYWFKDALEKGEESDYYNYYVWHEGVDKNKPNNWVSAFTQNEIGSAWSKYTYNGKETKKYYLHQFHWRQPDLNYRNTKLVQEMKDVLSFWVHRGVDGFRVDAIQHLVENEEFKDNTGKSDRDMQINQDLTYEIVKQWRDLLDREGALLEKDLVLMLEVYSDIDTLIKYFGSELRTAGNFPFNFFIISELKKEKLNAIQVETIIKKWEDNKPSFGWSNWVVGNHDNHRVGSRLGSDLIDAFNMLVTLLPGTAITYNGEEIGMLDNEELKVEDCKDPQACPSEETTEETEEYYKDNTRDYERTPFQWDSSENAGFTSGQPWLPVNENYDEVNVEVEAKDAGSHLSVYRKLAALRREPAVQRGEFHIESLNDNVLSFSRRNVSHAYVVLINFGNSSANVQLSEIEAYVDLPKMLTYVCSPQFNSTADISLENFELPGYASVVLTSENEKYPSPEVTDSPEVTTQGAMAVNAMNKLIFVSLMCVLVKMQL